MYTVAELIEALQQCPPDYEINIDADASLESVGIDPETKTVSLFAE